MSCHQIVTGLSTPGRLGREEHFHVPSERFDRQCLLERDDHFVLRFVSQRWACGRWQRLAYVFEPRPNCAKAACRRSRNAVLDGGVLRSSVEVTHPPLQRRAFIDRAALCGALGQAGGAAAAQTPKPKSSAGHPLAIGMDKWSILFADRREPLTELVGSGRGGATDWAPLQHLGTQLSSCRGVTWQERDHGQPSARGHRNGYWSRRCLQPCIASMVRIPSPPHKETA